MFHLLRGFVLSFAIASTAVAQDPPRVDVPIAPNASCPIMGKKVSLPLFVDTELGRIYVCCKPCFKKVLADVPTAHQTAYPVVEDTKNGVCPVSGEAIGDEAVTMTLQNRRFRLCCAGCEDTARKDAQIVLAKLAEPKLVDVGNETCPLTGDKVTPSMFVLIDDNVVRMATAKAVDEAKQAPLEVLAKARAIAKAQPPRKKHVHRPKADGNGADNEPPKPNSDTPRKTETPR